MPVWKAELPEALVVCSPPEAQLAVLEVQTVWLQVVSQSRQQAAAPGPAAV